MRLHTFGLAAVGTLLCGLIVYCKPAPITVTDQPCSDSGANCPCDPDKYLATDCYSGPLGTSGKGICKAGKRSCTPAGTLTECIGEVLPQTEVCNYQDDDCNGLFDDVPGIADAGFVAQCTSPACDPDFSDGGIECWTGKPFNACQAGARVCANGGGLGCRSVVHTGQPEVCNGWDDDCNDIIDDGLDDLGSCDVDPDAGFKLPDGGKVIGACAHSNTQCVDGGETCLPSDPAPEVCDGVDNDCNGKTDEGTCPGNSDPWCCLFSGEKTGFCESEDFSGSGTTCFRSQ